MQLSFIWHMHQPDYRDASGVMQMPWVFLHAIKDYFDMPWMLARHEGLKATFNITPPLIEQVELYYEHPHLYDRFLNLWLKEPSELGEGDRTWMIKLCKSVNVETMTEQLPHYKALYHLDTPNDTDLCDMQVLFMLAWCGVYLRMNSTVVGGLIERGSHYNCSDKQELLKELVKFIKTIFPYYATLRHEGRIALSTTPLNHPILPLLINMQNAVRANPLTDIPGNAVSLESDAVEQIQRAQALFHRTFGFEAIGFWPAEGAVDERSLALYRENGLRWVATDEAILFKSLGTSDRSKLYHPYRYDGVTMGFRDHGLSDLIGFTYRFWDAEKAAAHFVGALEPINASNPEATLFVILDGENAWEFYRNNAYDFFNALYNRLAQTPWCETVTMDIVSTQNATQLEKLEPGSWIHGQLNTWVGHREKTRGWELLFMTRRDYEHHASTLDKSIKEKILTHFLAAECSDWFWWYGDDHHTEFAVEFDELFRSHLIAVYDLMQMMPPADLYTPVIEHTSTQDFMVRPQFPITPTINGSHDTFFEWVGAGVIDETKLFSTMDRVRGPVYRILYGQDGQNVYLAFESDLEALLSCDRLVVTIEPGEVTFEIDLQQAKQGGERLELASENMTLIVACRNWLEWKIECSGDCADSLSMRFELERDGIVVQTLPGFGELVIDLQTTYAANWFV